MKENFSKFIIMISFQFLNINDLSDDERLQSEWLDTNGLGGWAGSTISGCHTRRYHGLLIAAITPPTERMVLVSKLDETIIVNDERFELSTNNYGNAIYPKGFQYLKSFTKNLYPQFFYEAGGVQLRKSILMVHGENTTIIKYEILKAHNNFSIELLPLLAFRGYHRLMHAYGDTHYNAEFENGQLKLRLFDNTPETLIQLPNSNFVSDPNWYYNFNYSIEQSRGLDFVEDLFSPGHLTVDAAPGDAFYVILSTENTAKRKAILLFENEIERRQKLISTESNEGVKQLKLAADQFIV